MQATAQAALWWENNILTGDPRTCSDSLFIYDIGTGGYPSYREDALNSRPNASRLFTTPDHTIVHGALLCPIFGCADFTIPIGQVPYISAVSKKMEMVPVSINMVIRRGCDSVVFDMIKKLADRGLLQVVDTGEEGFK